MRRSRKGDRGSGHAEKSQNIGFLRNTGLVLLKNHNATLLGRQQPASESWLAYDGPLLVVFGSYLPSLLRKNNVFRVPSCAKDFRNLISMLTWCIN